VKQWKLEMKDVFAIDKVLEIKVNDHIKVSNRSCDTDNNPKF